MKVHPAANIFPMMGDAELKELAADIKANGLREPITLHEDKILDGRNREKACRLAKVDVKTRNWKPKGTPLAYVLSLNLKRRHLTEPQKAAVAAEAVNLFEAENRTAIANAGKKAGPGKGGVNVTPPFKRDQSNRSTAKAAAATGAGVSSTATMKKVLEVAPEVHALAKQGKINVAQAKHLIGLPEAARKRAVKGIKTGEDPKRVVKQSKIAEKQRIARKIKKEPGSPSKGKFDVIVIDPPWRYDTAVETSNQRGLLAYPDMSIEEICALPVAEHAYKDCILWLWTTNSFMRQAYECLDAWGFTPKTILTWDKVNMATGYWLRNVTEHCILAVRGKPPINLTNERTLITEKRRQHSRKPEAFYKMVKKLSAGRRLDMFAREERKGFDVWGAETEKFG